MNRTNTIIIGAGQAGLALSKGLVDRGIDHVILERGRVAQSWIERWDSLRLLSPNWMTRLPGWGYRGPDPRGFMNREDVIGMLKSYARSIDAPVQEETTVLRVDPWHDGWKILTDRGVWHAANVVIATGYNQTTKVPNIARDLSPDVMQVTTSNYRNPEQLPEAGVLVVGASSSGAQLARELKRSGRDVVLAVGRHTRVPRRYRGKDIFDWLDRTGSLNRTRTSMIASGQDPHGPSMQLIGSETGEEVDLPSLAREGVILTGRLKSLVDGKARFNDDLHSTIADADDRMQAVLSRIDRYITASPIDRDAPSAGTLERIPILVTPQEMNLRQFGIRTVLWATGYTRSYPWLHAPVFDSKGEIRHWRGRTSEQGLYVLGLHFMIRRNSAFIDGVGRDASEIAESIAKRTHITRKEAA